MTHQVAALGQFVRCIVFVWRCYICDKTNTPFQHQNATKNVRRPSCVQHCWRSFTVLPTPHILMELDFRRERNVRGTRREGGRGRTGKGAENEQDREGRWDGYKTKGREGSRSWTRWRSSLCLPLTQSRL